MSKNIKIFIADDHPLLLKGLNEELLINGYNVVGTTVTGTEALKLIIKLKPDIAILDIQMPGISGFEVIKKSKIKKVQTKFVLLTSYKEKRFVIRAKTLNISGYLLKDEPFEEIEKCIQAIFNGGTYFSTVFNEVYDNQITPEIEKLNSLSPSELRIIQLIAQNKNTKEIAECLFISIRTVQKHRTNIILKLESTDLTIWAKANKDLIV